MTWLQAALAQKATSFRGKKRCDDMQMHHSVEGRMLA